MAEERTSEEAKTHIIECKLDCSLVMSVKCRYEYVLSHIARRRAEKKRLGKLGKSTDTEEEDGELDDEGIWFDIFAVIA